MNLFLIKTLIKMTDENLTNTSDLIVKKLIEHIVKNDFAQNVLPSENDLCKKFEVSRTTLRAALQTLAAKGIIRKQPKKKAEILNREEWDWFDPKLIEYAKASIDKNELLYHACALRLTFEPKASALCALNSNFSDLTDLDLGNKLMIEAIKNGDHEQFTKGDIKFHRAIFRGTHNPFFMRLCDLILHTSLLSIENTVESKIEDLKQAVEEHNVLMEAIRFKQADKAQSVMHQILLDAIIKIFPQNVPNYYDII